MCVCVCVCFPRSLSSSLFHTGTGERCCTLANSNSKRDVRSWVQPGQVVRCYFSFLFSLSSLLFPIFYVLSPSLPSVFPSHSFIHFFSRLLPCICHKSNMLQLFIYNFLFSIDFYWILPPTRTRIWNCSSSWESCLAWPWEPRNHLTSTWRPWSGNNWWEYRWPQTTLRRYVFLELAMYFPVSISNQCTHAP